jgi:Putative zinc-finger
MKHRQWKEWLQLSLYDELASEEQRQLGMHIKECASCRKDLEEIKRIHALLAQHATVPVTEMQLQDARRSMRSAVLGERSRLSFAELFSAKLNAFLIPRWVTAAGSIVLLAAGAAAGYFFFKTPENLNGFQTASAGSTVERGESQIANIRFIDRDEKSGTVDFSFDALTPVHVRGSLNDERIQKMLAHALVGEQNAGMRLRTVNLFGTYGESKEKSPNLMDDEVKKALITALQYDQNLGVRKEALDVLSRYLPDSTVTRAFLFVLANEKNTGLRIAAINSFDLSKYEHRPISKDLLSAFQQKAQSDENSYIRLRAGAALQEIHQ